MAGPLPLLMTIKRRTFFAASLRSVSPAATPSLLMLQIFILLWQDNIEQNF